MIEILDINQMVLELHEADSKQDLLEGLHKIFTEKSKKAFKDQLVGIAEGNTKIEFEGIVRTLKGKEIHVLIRWAVVPGFEENMERIYVSTIDISKRKRAEKIKSDQNKILEFIAQGSCSQTDVLEAIIKLAEEQFPETRCSILLLENKTIKFGAAPSMPAEYNAQIDGLEIGPSVGSCGTAMYRKAPVIVEDVSNDPLWAGFNHLGENMDSLQVGRTLFSTPTKTFWEASQFIGNNQEDPIKRKFNSLKQ